MDLFIGVDSGPTHLAAAHDIPVVAIRTDCSKPLGSSGWQPRNSESES